MKNLQEIRCPFMRRSKKDNKLYNCNRICVKVTPGSSGEAMCRSCHLTFEFTVKENKEAKIQIRVAK